MTPITAIQPMVESFRNFISEKLKAKASAISSTVPDSTVQNVAARVETRSMPSRTKTLPQPNPIAASKANMIAKAKVLRFG